MHSHAPPESAKVKLRRRIQKRSPIEFGSQRIGVAYPKAPFLLGPGKGQRAAEGGYREIGRRSAVDDG
jgi:hypothetical protein